MAPYMNMETAPIILVVLGILLISALLAWKIYSLIFDRAGYAGAEKRAFKRGFIASNVEVSAALDFGQPAELPAQVANISQAGVCLAVPPETADQIKAGDKVTLRLSCSGKKAPYIIEATAKWIGPHRSAEFKSIGFAFSVTPENQKRLRSMAKSLVKGRNRVPIKTEEFLSSSHEEPTDDPS
jgi:hypothetical protein